MAAVVVDFPASQWVLNVYECDAGRIPESCRPAQINLGPYGTETACDKTVRDGQRNWPQLPPGMRYAYECFRMRR